MILKASQRGGASQLASHLLKTKENEHVEIHELSGFMADDLRGALNEIYAVSRGTKCQQFMFSVSLNPPETENVPIEYFENAIADIEEKTGLKDQPRAVVFHEKEGRRHCHTVWSRIDIDQMKAINLPYYKMKLQDISRQLYFQYGWQMPKGLLNKEERNPLNFSLAQWQQAKRLDEDPKLIKKLFQDCWAVSDNKQSFEQALKDYGLYLARGDRRGYVAVDYRGEVFSLSRGLKVKPKELKQRLGNPESLLSIKAVKSQIAERITDKLQTYIQEAQTQLKQQVQPFIQKKRSLQHQHQNERQRLQKKHEERWRQESITRSQRLPRGMKGIWFRIIGKYQKIWKQNEAETEKCRIRDRDQKQQLIDRQLTKRQKLQEQVRPLIEAYKLKKLKLKQDIARYMELNGTPPKNLQEEFSRDQKDRDIDYTPEL